MSFLPLLFLYYPVKLLCLIALAGVAIEFAFFVIKAFHLLPMVNRRTTPPQSPLGPKETFRRIIDATARVQAVYPFRQFLEGWFHDVAVEDIYEGNMRSFIAWAGWHRQYQDLSPEDMDVVDETLDYIRDVHGVSFPAGHNGQVQHMAFTLEDVDIAHVPLAIYLLNYLIHFTSGLYLHAIGFTRYRTPETGITYWHRPATPGTQDHNEGAPLLPLLFFHGIGPGLWFYLPFLNRLHHHRRRDCVYIEIDHITTTLSFKVAHWTTVVKAVEQLSEMHGISHYCVAGHSFGSIVAGWVVRELPHRVKKLVLIDPVSPLLCLPNVTSGFLYNNHKNNRLDFSKEITVANTLKRNFWWYEKILWVEDIKCPVVCALSERDHIVPSTAVQHYLQTCHPRGKVIMWPGFHHGQFLQYRDQQKELVEAIEEQEEQEEEENAFPVTPAKLIAEETKVLIRKLPRTLSRRLSSSSCHKTESDFIHPKPLPLAPAATVTGWEVATSDVSALLKDLRRKITSYYKAKSFPSTLVPLAAAGGGGGAEERGR